MLFLEISAKISKKSCNFAPIFENLHIINKEKAWIK